MESSRFLTVVVVCVLQGWAVQGDDLCLVTGTQCSTNCEDIILCPTQYGKPMKVLTCDTKRMCGTDADGRPGCIAESCDNGVFICTTSGSEPDPANATAYYTCPGVGTRGTNRACDPGTFFNSTTERCSEDTRPHEPVVCNEPGKMGAVDPDQEFCFICDQQRKPLVYPCEMDHFNQIDHKLLWKLFVSD